MVLHGNLKVQSGKSFTHMLLSLRAIPTMTLQLYDMNVAAEKHSRE